MIADLWARLRAWLDLDGDSFDETVDDSWGNPDKRKDDER